MTPQERYEADRLPGLSPDWDQLAEATREAYAHNGPRYQCMSFKDGPTPGVLAEWGFKPLPERRMGNG